MQIWLREPQPRRHLRLTEPVFGGATRIQKQHDDAFGSRATNDRRHLHDQTASLKCIVRAIVHGRDSISARLVFGGARARSRQLIKLNLKKHRRKCEPARAKR